MVNGISHPPPSTDYRGVWNCCHTHTHTSPLRFIWGGADKSLAQPTSRCRRTESMVSLERGVCSCAELQVLSSYRGWRKYVRRRTRFQQNGDVSCHEVFFLFNARRRRKFTPFWQKRYGNTHHRTPPSRTRWPSLKVVVFPPVMRLVLKDPNGDHPGDYWANSRDNLGRQPDFG